MSRADRSNRLDRLEQQDAPAAPQDPETAARHRAGLVAALLERFRGMRERLLDPRSLPPNFPRVDGIGQPETLDGPGAADVRDDGEPGELSDAAAERVAAMVNETRRLMYGPGGTFAQLEQPPDVTAADVKANLERARARGTPGDNHG